MQNWGGSRDCRTRLGVANDARRNEKGKRGRGETTELGGEVEDHDSGGSLQVPIRGNNSTIPEETRNETSERVVRVQGPLGKR